MPVAFKKAERRSVKLKLAITGPSGSGKTWGALALAEGLAPGGRYAVIDTENGSASLYADRFKFDVLEILPPYTTDKYAEALKAAIAAKYDVVIVDSITHEWAGEGGLLAQKDAKDQQSGGRGNSFTNWGEMTAKHEKFKGDLLKAPVHLIATMRSKTEYAIETDSRGKQVPKKLGLAPIQRDGMEYEFSVVFDVAQNHEAMASKDRTAIFDQVSFKLSDEVGAKLREWMLKGGEEPVPQAEAPAEAPPAAVPPKIHAVPPPAEPAPTGIAQRIGAAKTLDELKPILREFQPLTPEEKKTLWPVYAAREKALKSGGAQ